MWKKLTAVAVAAIGISMIHTSISDARKHSQVSVAVHSGAAIHSRAQFVPPGWRHGRKMGWGCTPGTRGCIPPGLR